MANLTERDIVLTHSGKAIVEQTLAAQEAG